MRILLIGDSITLGVGDESHLGIDGNIGKMMQCDIKNMSINGCTTTQLMDVISDKNNQNIIQNTQVIIVSVGGNDLLHQLVPFDMRKIMLFANKKQEMVNNFEKSINTLIEINPSAQILLLGIYNPMGKENGIVYNLSDILVGYWNNIIQNYIARNHTCRYIPIHDIFDRRTNICLDGLHPSACGYQQISTKIMKILPNEL
jgi:lysophospholipase L1-like esterase